uniref:GP2b glycoprotein n=1 Tax=Equine arteritis virus TaxID=11047 RepID=V9ISA1_EAV|nr:GP2b glycoprotein [Equine arteritis virus]
MQRFSFSCCLHWLLLLCFFSGLLLPLAAAWWRAVHEVRVTDLFKDLQCDNLRAKDAFPSLGYALSIGQSRLSYMLQDWLLAAHRKEVMPSNVMPMPGLTPDCFDHLESSSYAPFINAYRQAILSQYPQELLLEAINCKLLAVVAPALYHNYHLAILTGPAIWIVPTMVQLHFYASSSIFSSSVEVLAAIILLFACIPLVTRACTSFMRLMSPSPHTSSGTSLQRKTL